MQFRSRCFAYIPVTQVNESRDGRLDKIRSHLIQSTKKQLYKHKISTLDSGVSTPNREGIHLLFSVKNTVIVKTIPQKRENMGVTQMTVEQGTTVQQGLPRLATVENTAIVFTEAGETQASIRANIFKAEDRINSRGEKIPGNGLAASGAIIRRGRKVLIDLDRYGAWLAGRVEG